GAELPEHRDWLYQPAAFGDPDRLHALLTRAAFRDVSVTTERRSLAFESFEEYWAPIEAGGGRLGQFYRELPPDQRQRVRGAVERRMAALRSGGQLVLEVEAFIGGGVR